MHTLNMNSLKFNWLFFSSVNLTFYLGKKDWDLGKREEKWNKNYK